MSLLRRTRAEVAGAWRSVRYDMGRRPVEPPAGGPDVTSTGMSTFGVPAVDEFERPRAGARASAPRRAAAVTAFGMLTVLGAAGAYLGVVNGLGSLLHESEAAAGTVPPQPAVTSTFTPNTGIGRGPAVRPAPAITVAPDPATTEPPPAPAEKASPIRTLKATNPICRCGSQPPVPTPTAPISTPSPTPSAGPDPSDSGQPDPGESSAAPSDSADPSKSPQARHRRHRR